MYILKTIINSTRPHKWITIKRRRTNGRILVVNIYIYKFKLFSPNCAPYTFELSTQS